MHFCPQEAAAIVAIVAFVEQLPLLWFWAREMLR